MPASTVICSCRCYRTRRPGQDHVQHQMQSFFHWQKLALRNQTACQLLVLGSSDLKQLIPGNHLEQPTFLPTNKVITSADQGTVLSFPKLQILSQLDP